MPAAIRLRRAVLASAVASAAAVLGVSPQPAHAAEPAFQLPFACDQNWTGSVRGNHNPPLSVDWTRGGPSTTVNQPVVASASGTVSLVSSTGNYGNRIVIDHGGGWQTLYAHLAGFNVGQGAHVEAGDRIGTVGSTGNSTGPHLHYEQRLGGTVVRSVLNGSAFVDGSTLRSRNCPAAPQPPAPDTGMTGFAPADFNGDGRTDLAAVDAATGKMFLYPGTGLGTFGERTLIGTNWDSLTNVTPGDFNGDGKADIAAVGKSDGNLYVYPGTGTGAFGAPWSAGTGWNSLHHFSAGDFNGDGKADIAAVGIGDGNLYVFPGTGTGWFAAPINAGNGWNNLDRFTGGDFNGDGKADIAAVGIGDGNLYVFPGTGTGWFAAPVGAGSGWNIMRDLVGGDFNADGRTDVAAVQAPRGAAGTMYLYPGTGQNTFGTRSTIGTDW
ncbi:FG-GAP-like repeat-containing protein [Kitasatospora sp. NPDC056327]|uniref:FG-GAP-like repeat-containing protein n=1 Tax=Kitasatospora sp. NPDC056327 TaxID=3345785 RepID=UPI0035E24425